MGCLFLGKILKYGLRGAQPDFNLQLLVEILYNSVMSLRLGSFQKKWDVSTPFLSNNGQTSTPAPISVVDVKCMYINVIFLSFYNPFYVRKLYSRSC